MGFVVFIVAQQALYALAFYEINGEKETIVFKLYLINIVLFIPEVIYMFLISFHKGDMDDFIESCVTTIIGLFLSHILFYGGLGS